MSSCMFFITVHLLSSHPLLEILKQQLHSAEQQLWRVSSKSMAGAVLEVLAREDNEGDMVDQLTSLFTGEDMHKQVKRMTSLSSTIVGQRMFSE